MKSNTPATPQPQHKPATTFFPGAGAAFFGPATAPAPAGLLQRTPEDTGDIHEGIAEEYRRSHGLTEGDGISDAEIVYHLSDPVFVLNHEPHTSRAYAATVNAWPGDRQIWPVLESPSAKIIFLRFVLHFDQTNCRPYSTGGGSGGGSCEATTTALETFRNVCQGFATQMYTRYTATDRMDATTTGRLASLGRIEVGEVPAKFHMPVLIASVPGHAFNAVQIADDAGDVQSYVFFEPQSDRVFMPDSAILRSGMYAAAGYFELSRLAGFNEAGQYNETTTQTFLLNGSGAFTAITLDPTQRIAVHHLMANLFIVEDPATWNLLLRNRPGITFESNLQEVIAGMPDATLALVFPYLNGRRLRRTTGGAMETMDRALFLQLMNRPDLAGLLP
ncbi:hypothetical protein WJU16_25400 [Chitinophaga pollutisoli]|uniref:Uncharacterized protein n=1 Tax=Chitinophaga pollutisoli TaxID=3133966 RepID=A0ABZ2YNI3_9BACT